LTTASTVCSITYTVPPAFGQYLRRRREALRKTDPRFSVRQVAARIGVEPSYLSKVERGAEPPPSEARIRALAEDLGDDPDVLLALAGKVSSDLQEIILRRPALMAEIIRELKRLPAHAVLRIVREVREGDW
jgi:transcriptional regulator with XRE-family HTH domain